MKKELRKKVWMKYDKHCAYCGSEIEFNEMQIDHIKPAYHNFNDSELLQMGLTRGLDEFENYNPACRQCNFYKSTLSINSFKTLLLTVHERISDMFLVKIGLKYGVLKFGKPFDGKFYFEKCINDETKHSI